MSRSMKPVLAALGIVLVVLNFEAQAAEHHGKEAHASPSPSASPPVHNGGGTHASVSASSHSGGNSSSNSSGPSINAGGSFSHSSGMIQSSSPAPAFSSAPVHQGTFSQSAPSVPFSNTVVSQPKLGNSASLLNVAPQVGIRSGMNIARQSSGTNAIEVPNNARLNNHFSRSEQINSPTQSQTPPPVNNAVVATPRIVTERSIVHNRNAAANVSNANSRLNHADSGHVETPTLPSTPVKNVLGRTSNDVTESFVVPERIHVSAKTGVTQHTEVSRNTPLPAFGNATQHSRSASPNQVESLHRTHDGNLRFGALAASVNSPHEQPVGHERGNQRATTTERLKAGHLDHLVNSDIARQVDLKKQFQLREHGDLARRLKLSDELKRHGGWHERLAGPISPVYTKRAFGHFYAGPGYYPNYCWFPNWSPWVNWCWNFNFGASFDPRPVFCQPIVYDPCQPWTGWNYPVWSGLPDVSCGTWVDVPTVTIPTGIDVQLLAVRFVDPGHPEKKMGPRYRVWIRNNSAIPVEQPFDLVIYASNEQVPRMGLPETGVRVTGMEAGQTQAIDLRLPYEANLLDRDPQGRRIPFRYLHIIADSRRELADVDPDNNGAVVDRLEILSVDPSIFSAALDNASSRLVIDIAGEGLGPEAGQVVVQIGGQELTPEILGWCDVGVQVRIPNLPLTETTKAEILVIRGDNAASNPLPVKIPAESVPEITPNPVP